MKAETFLKPTLCHSSLSFTYNRYENGHQLVRLVCQRLQLISPAKSCSFQQLQPIRCLLKFLHATFYVDRRTTVFVTLAGKTCPSSFLGGTSTFREFPKRQNDGNHWKVVKNNLEGFEWPTCRDDA